MLLVGWFLFIGPQNTETSSLEDQTVTAELRAGSLTRQLSELRQQNEELPKYKAQLARDRQALPAAAGMSDFLRQLQAAGDSTGVSVDGVTVGSPTRAVGAVGVQALPVMLTVAGPGAKLSRFLDQLQRVQPRAVLISSTNAVTGDPNGSIAGSSSLTLTLQVFTAGATG
jgi:Tfp pilus assembly protein PilO